MFGGFFLTMTRNHETPRTALTAIAAVLALGSTSALAQEAGTASPAVDPAGSEIVIPDAQRAPTAVPLPTTAPPLTTVAPIVTQSPAAPSSSALTTAPIVAPEATTAGAADTPSQARQAAPSSSETTSAPAERTSSARAVSTRPTAARELAPQRVASDAVAPAEAQPQAVEAAPATTAPMVNETPQPAPLETTGEAASSDNTAIIIGGAGALVLLGAGFMAFRRRKTYDREIEADAMEREVIREPVVTPKQNTVVNPASAPAIAPRAPVDSSAPIMQRSTVVREGDLEQQVAAAPSRENPFLTRKNRLRRANFLMRQGALPEAAPATMDRQTAEAAAPATQPQAPARQTVYSFGGTTVRPTQKPRTT
ncbi:LPXTG-motif cell wall-anchored protein [Sphingobium sp. B12D2B]|nr:LPXTG-motif cell wall-anchored protein [Sphingobium sp. B12D2B]